MAEISRRQHSRLSGGALLGPLEFEIMAAIWKRGPSTVTEIAYILPQKPAHTTILSTGSRLIAKGLLRRGAKSGRADTYAATCTQQEWYGMASREAVQRFLSTPNVPQEALLSSLRDALGANWP